MRTFKVTDGIRTTIYRGFNPVTYNKPPTVLALVYNEGDYECWAVDYIVDDGGKIAPQPSAIEQLKKMYSEQHGFENVAVNTFVSYHNESESR